MGRDGEAVLQQRVADVASRRDVAQASQPVGKGAVEGGLGLRDELRREDAIRRRVDAVEARGAVDIIAVGAVAVALAALDDAGLGVGRELVVRRRHRGLPAALGHVLPRDRRRQKEAPLRVDGVPLGGQRLARRHHRGRRLRLGGAPRARLLPRQLRHGCAVAACALHVLQANGSGVKPFPHELRPLATRPERLPGRLGGQDCREV